MTRDRLRACIARTGCKLIARHNGRAFAVPAFTNDVSPAASTLSLLGQRGEGATVNSPTVAPASSDVSNLLHGSH